MRLVELGRRLRPSPAPAETFQCRHCETRYDIQFHVCPQCSGFCVDTVDDVRRTHDTAD
jgi:hypothetical protein